MQIVFDQGFGCVETAQHTYLKHPPDDFKKTMLENIHSHAYVRLNMRQSPKV